MVPRPLTPFFTPLFTILFTLLFTPSQREEAWERKSSLPGPLDPQNSRQLRITDYQLNAIIPRGHLPKPAASEEPWSLNHARRLHQRVELEESTREHAIHQVSRRLSR